MDYNKILYWKNWSWKNFILFIIVVIILFLILQSVIFLTTPTKTEVESFLKENSCNPFATKTDSDSEYPCAYYLRRHTALVFGQIINAGFPLVAFTPFGYFSYDPSADDFHAYVFVVTRNEGPLVYNPVNGAFIGRYDDLMLEMGCEVQPYEKPFFPIQPKKNKLEMERFRCTSNILTQMLDALKLNSTDK